MSGLLYGFRAARHFGVLLVMQLLGWLSGCPDCRAKARPEVEHRWGCRRGDRAAWYG